LNGAADAATPSLNASGRNTAGFWPNGARLAVSFSLMFEGGGQPISGAGGVIPDPIETGIPDLPTNAFFAYGHYEGIPRVLDLMDKHGVKLSSFMIGKAVETSPDIAREIVRRGHEVAAHGRVWSNSYQLPRDQEKRFIADGVDTIQRVTGQKPIGWNAYWMRNSIYILETLQELGFLYHIDEPSRDEPFIVPVRGGAQEALPPNRRNYFGVPSPESWSGCRDGAVASRETSRRVGTRKSHRRDRLRG
jgi:peptidoglycan/xylan/chitin deacetylase (PgdA/CDA1 family)